MLVIGKISALVQSCTLNQIFGLQISLEGAYFLWIPNKWLNAEQGTSSREIPSFGFFVIMFLSLTSLNFFKSTSKTISEKQEMPIYG